MKQLGVVGAGLVLPASIVISAACILDAALPYSTWPALNKALTAIPDPLKAGAVVLTAVCAYLVIAAAVLTTLHGLWGGTRPVVDAALFLAAVAWPVVGLTVVGVVIPGLTLWTIAVWACKAGAILSLLTPAPVRTATREAERRRATRLRGMGMERSISPTSSEPDSIGRTLCPLAP